MIGSFKRWFCCSIAEPENLYYGGHELRYEELGKLHRAAATGNVPKIYKLLKKRNICHLDRANRTPLHLACANGCPDAVSALLKSVPWQINFQDSDLMTPLLKAIQCGQEECAAILIESGAHIQTKDIRGKTALDYAACLKSNTLTAALIDRGATIELKLGDLELVQNSANSFKTIDGNEGDVAISDAMISSYNSTDSLKSFEENEREIASNTETISPSITTTDSLKSFEENEKDVAFSSETMSPFVITNNSETSVDGSEGDYECLSSSSVTTINAAIYNNTSHAGAVDDAIHSVISDMLFGEDNFKLTTYDNTIDELILELGLEGDTESSDKSFPFDNTIDILITELGMDDSSAVSSTDKFTSSDDSIQSLILVTVQPASLCQPAPCHRPASLSLPASTWSQTSQPLSVSLSLPVSTWSQTSQSLSASMHLVTDQPASLCQPAPSNRPASPPLSASTWSQTSQPLSASQHLVTD